MNSFFKQIKYLESIDSTNSYLKNNSHLNNTLVYTFNQSSGRGRNNKKWIDTTDRNLALSFIINPFDSYKNNLWLIAATSLSLIKKLNELKIKNSWIKWPNDIYIKDFKLSGILAESIWQSNELRKIIIGIGININTTEEDFKKLDNKATSIFIQTKEHQDMHDFTNSIISNISFYLSKLINDKNIEQIKKEWFKHSKIINKKVKWDNDKESRIGKVKGIDNDGILELKIKNKLYKVTSGDITLI